MRTIRDNEAGANTATPVAEADFTREHIYSVLVRAIAARNPGVTGPAQDVEFIVNVRRRKRGRAR